MANRSYLFSTNHLPSRDLKQRQRGMVGIAEFSYDIPLVFKILVSGNPRTCSSIFETPENIAIVAEYDLGIARLFQFLDRITTPGIEAFKEEAHEFLAEENNKRRYFVLECGEIFGMDDSPPLQDQNERLLEEVKHLDPQLEQALAQLVALERKKAKPVSLFKRVLNVLVPPPKSEKNPMEPLVALGLGHWENDLFYEP